jgi:predicted Zn-dependent protease
LNEAIALYEEFYNKNLAVPIKIDYANVLIEADRNINLAISILESAKDSEYLNREIYRLLAKGYGRQKREGMSLLMSARELMLAGKYREARRLLTDCLDKLDKKTESSQRAKAKYLKELLDRDYKEFL